MLETLFCPQESARFKDLNELSVALLGPGLGEFDHLLTQSSRASTFGQVFAVAYRSALQRLLPQLNIHQWAAFSVTEASGNHPRNIEAYLSEDGRIYGQKTFVSMGDLAKQIILIVKQGDVDGRPNLKAVLVSTLEENLNIVNMPSLGLLKEIPHGTLTLDGACGQILAGDGHTEYSQAFRWQEDICLLASFCGYFHGHLKLKPEQALGLKRCLSILFRLKHLEVRNDVNAVILQTCFEDFQALVTDILQDSSDHLNGLKTQIEAEKKLFSLAKGARQARFERAWSKLYGA